MTAALHSARSFGAGCALALLLCLAPRASGQASAVLAGTVVDAETGGGLAATVTARPLSGGDAPDTLPRPVGDAADGEGAYRLEIASGRWAVAAQHPGFETVRDTLTLDGDAVWSPRLLPLGLGEVVVAAERGGDDRDRGGVTQLDGREIAELPALLGEPDVLKAVQLLPGVRGGAEGSAGLYVRGGSPDHTLILLDGAPVYNPSHLFGFVSAFDASAVGSVSLERGPTPARWGGRLGSVLDVRTRDADGVHLDGRLGLLAAAVSAEVGGERAGVLVSARRSTIDLITRPLFERAADTAAKRGEARVIPVARFADVTAHAHWQGRRDRLDVTGFAGGDHFEFTSEDPNEAAGTLDVSGGVLDWGNRLASARWTHVVSDRFLTEVALSGSDYGVDVGVSQTLGEGGDAPEAAQARYRSGIRTLGGAASLQAVLGRHALRAGVQLATRRFTPGALSVAGTDDGLAVDTAFGALRTDALDAALYAEDAVDLGRLRLGLGLRGALYQTAARRDLSIEPRLTAAVRLGDRLTVRGAVARSRQPLHLLTTGAGIGLPADLWVPADRVGPESAWEWSAGAGGSLGLGTTWSVDGYARRMDGLIAYREGASFATPFEDWQDLVVQGEGRARGVEMMLRHRTPRLSGWLAYTLASTERRFDVLNGGDWFPYRYDRRHDVSAATVYRWGRLDLSAVAVYATGDAVTLPTAEYDAARYRTSARAWLGAPAVSDAATEYASRNGHRLPPTARLDLGVTFYLRRGAHPHAISLDVYNVTNRKNPFLTTLETRSDAAGALRRQLVGVGVAPVLPTLTYRFGL